MIKKNSNEYLSESYWIEKLKLNLDKVAVQSAKKDNDLFNQISNVVKSKKPKYSSVSEAVEEMMERSGLTNYIKNKVKLSKKASTDIRLFKEFPQAQITTDNVVESMGGYSSIPAIISKIKSLHSNDVNDESLFEDESLIKYIASKNIEEKSKNPKHENNEYLGKIHHDDNNAENSDDVSIIFGK